MCKLKLTLSKYTLMFKPGAFSPKAVRAFLGFSPWLEVGPGAQWVGELPRKAPARQGVMLCGPSFHKDVGFLFALVTGTAQKALTQWWSWGQRCFGVEDQCEHPHSRMC